MKYLVYFLILLFPFGQLLRLNLGQTAVTLHANDFAAAGVVFFWLMAKRNSLRQKIAKDPLTKPLLLWTAAMLLSLIVNLNHYLPGQILIGSLYLLRFLAYSGVYFVFKDLDASTKKASFRLLALAALIVAVAGLLQYFLLPDVSFLKAFNWDDHYYRLVSTFLDPGFTGAVLVFGLVLVFLWRKNLPKYSAWAVMGVIYTALALTYSRASYVMYVSLFALVGFFQRSAKVFIIAVLILAITIPLLPKTKGEGTKLGRENSIEARINNWKQSLAIWSRYPVFGSGYDTYRYVQNISDTSHSGAGADSSILLVLETTGIVGFSAYLWLGISMFRLGRTSLLFSASLIAVFIHSWFNNTLFYPWIMEWVWVSLALSDHERT